MTYIPTIPMTLIVQGAYGREYITEAAALKDWEANKDFEILSPGYPTYVNKQQISELKRMNIDTLKIRFFDLDEFVEITL